MNNLVIVKKAQRIQIIAISSYIVTLIGSLNIIMRIIPDEYIGISAILTFVGTIIFQISMYKFFVNKWLQKGFSQTSEPDELLRLLQNAKLISKKYTLVTIKEKYNIKYKKQDKAEQPDSLPVEICVYPNRTFNFVFLVFMSLVSIFVLYWFIVSKSPISILMLIVTIFSAISFGRKYFSKNPLLKMNSKGITIKNINLKWDLVKNWEINNASKETFKLIIYTSNKKMDVTIPFANYEIFEIDYYIKKYIEKNTKANS